jgi:hypothetical protein
MASLWPWLAVAGAGALHGLNPASGWLLASAWQLRASGPRPGWRALWPIAAGHALSMVLAVGIAFGTGPGRGPLRTLALGLLLVAGVLHGLACIVPRTRALARCAGLAIGAFAAATVHGAGLMLVPALTPWCGTASPSSRSGFEALAMAVTAIGVHTAAMLLVTAAVAAGISAIRALATLTLSISPAPIRRGSEAAERFRCTTPRESPPCDSCR